MNFDVQFTENKKDFTAGFGEHTDIKKAVYRKLEEAIATNKQNISNLTFNFNTHQRAYNELFSDVETAKSGISNNNSLIQSTWKRLLELEDHCNTKTAIRSVAELPKTLDELQGLADLYEIHKLEGTLIGNAGELHATMFIVDALPEDGIPSTEERIYIYYCLRDDALRIYGDPEFSLPDLTMILITARDQMHEDISAIYFLIDEEKSGSRLYALDVKSLKAYQDVAIGVEPAPLSYVELTSSGGASIKIHNVAELPESPEDGLYKVSNHKGALAIVNNGELAEASVVSAYFVDALPEVGLPTVFDDSEEIIPEFINIYITIADGKKYLFVDGEWKDEWDVIPLCYSEEEVLESVSSFEFPLGILIKEKYSKLYLVQGTSIELLADDEDCFKKSEAEEALAYIDKGLETKEEKYQLISTTELTEDVQAVNINVDINLYKHFKFYFFGKITPNVSTNFTSRIVIAGDVIYLSYGSATTFTDANYAFGGEVEIVEGVGINYKGSNVASNDATTTSSAGFLNRWILSVNQFKAFSFRLTSATTAMLAGSKILIYAY